MKSGFRININYSDLSRLSAVMAKMASGGRTRLNRLGAYAVQARVQQHINRYATARHMTANMLGGRKTGHYEKGAAAITSTASADEAEVSIPIPGISRALHDIDITTPTRNGKRFITIAKHAESYGKSVLEMRMRGWTIFRPGKKKCLLGYRNKGEKPVLLFILAEEVHQKKDPSLLPLPRQLSETFAHAQKNEIVRIIRKAKR